MGKHELLRIRDILSTKGMSIKDLKSVLGDEISYTYLSEIIRGDKFPRPDTLLKIAEALDEDIRELFHPTKKDKATKKIFEQNDDGTFSIVGVLFESDKTDN